MSGTETTAPDKLANHCHDTRGPALADVLAPMSDGVAVVDASVAGSVGFPFSPGAGSLEMLCPIKFSCEIIISTDFKIGSTSR